MEDREKKKVREVGREKIIGEKMNGMKKIRLRGNKG